MTQVERILKEVPHIPNAVIARALGVSKTWVGEVRDRLGLAPAVSYQQAIIQMLREGLKEAEQ